MLSSPYGMVMLIERIQSSPVLNLSKAERFVESKGLERSEDENFLFN